MCERLCLSGGRGVCVCVCAHDPVQYIGNNSGDNQQEVQSTSFSQLCAREHHNVGLDAADT